MYADSQSGVEEVPALIWKRGVELPPFTRSNPAAVQLLEHPDSVWAACGLPGGDIATACNDGVVRLFTRNLDRAA